MELLNQSDNLKFMLFREFDDQFLLPVGNYVLSKIQNKAWDDYNELYHAAKLIEFLRNDQRFWFDTHVIYRDETVIGVLFIVGGNLSQLETRYPIENESESLLLKYFHIIEKGKGYGSYWINSILIPYYREKGFKRIYINSSHKESFPFYSRFSQSFAHYEQESDNKRYKRAGQSFLLKLS